MLQRILIGLLLITTTNSFSQGVKTDTVQRGYYVPLDSNVLSCKIGITPKGKKLQTYNLSGNKLPDSTIYNISHLEAGSVVIYSEITVLKKGVMEKANTVRYVIGNKNTGVVKRDPTYPDTMSAKEIGAIVLDRHVYSFSVSWILNGNMYNYDITGNGIFGDCRTAVEALPSGTKVYIENIRRANDDGSKQIMPTEVHVVR